MPQMMPINWIFIFFFSSLIFIMIILMNYFIFLKKIKNYNYIPKFLNQNTWKW